jgi:hypothetical protein
MELDQTEAERKATNPTGFYPHDDGPKNVR